MEWTLYCNDHVIRRRNAKSHDELLLFDKSSPKSGELTDQRMINADEEDLVEAGIEMIRCVREGGFSGSIEYRGISDEVVETVSESTDVELVERGDKNTGIFTGIEDLTPTEKEFLDSQYKGKMELPDMVSASNRITNLFISAGFATAIVHYNPLWSVGLGSLSVIVFLTAAVTITQIRTEITSENAPSLYEVFSEVESKHDVKGTIYAVPSVFGSPFTIPYVSADVYFPTETIGKLTEGEIKAIIEHELGHHDERLTNILSMVATMASTLFVGPAIFYFGGIQPDLTMFILLVCYSAVVQLVVLTFNRIDEQKADESVSRQSKMVRALVRISPSVYHVDGTFQSVTHRLFDVHPPMNKRIESLYDGVEIDVDVGNSWSAFAWLGTASVIIGSLLIGYGFLTFTAESVPRTYIFYGTLLMLFGMVPQYYENKGLKATIGIAIALCVSFGLTVGIGFWMGADTIVGAVAEGRIGRQVFSLFVMMCLVVLFLASSVVFDYSPDDHEILSPASDWFDYIEEEDGF